MPKNILVEISVRELKKKKKIKAPSHVFSNGILGLSNPDELLREINHRINQLVSGKPQEMGGLIIDFK